MSNAILRPLNPSTLDERLIFKIILFSKQPYAKFLCNSQTRANTWYKLLDISILKSEHKLMLSINLFKKYIRINNTYYLNYVQKIFKIKT
ncbi:hypothetical protein [Borrelia turicatae]|uniref:hypothetical protein n=1 Tax=Borrelia turicatae TaxID=142 RepID=UPI0011AB6FD4|nr:hypothetical protein [Borrelia turicatae]UPA14258.1 hypothetical protein bt91E135_001435 [Borrelia turicatae 91E135]UPA15854.1 hypothetical protein btBTE5EL_001586 [Borrelia turicatae]